MDSQLAVIPPPPLINGTKRYHWGITSAVSELVWVQTIQSLTCSHQLNAWRLRWFLLHTQFSVFFDRVKSSEAFVQKTTTIFNLAAVPIFPSIFTFIKTHATPTERRQINREWRENRRNLSNHIGCCLKGSGEHTCWFLSPRHVGLKDRLAWVSITPWGKQRGQVLSSLLKW